MTNYHKKCQGENGNLNVVEILLIVSLKKLYKMICRLQNITKDDYVLLLA